MKRKINLFLVMTLALSSTISVSAAEFNDTKGHWAESSIDEWSDYGVVSGYTDGSFKPKDSITRAELAALIDKTMQYKEVGANNFTDLTGSEWYAASILKNVDAGNMNGYADGTVGANKNITRQEVAVMLCNAFDIETISGTTTFADDSSIPDWSKSSINALQKSGYVNGRTGNKFEPKAEITRAEVVTMLDNIVSDLYYSEGTYSENTNGNVLVNTSDVVLKDKVITGDLFVAAGVGEGDITLDNVQVNGEVIVEGGGVNSVKFINGSKSNGVKVQKNSSNPVRVYVDGDSNVSRIETLSEAKVKLEGQGNFGTLTANGTNSIEIAEGTNVAKLVINAGGSFVINGTVGDIVIVQGASPVSIKGSGSANLITVGNVVTAIDLIANKVIVINYSDSISLTDKVVSVVDGNDKAIQINNNTNTGSTTGSTGGGSSSGGGGGGGGYVTDTTAPQITVLTATNITSESATLTFTSNEAGTYSYKLNNGEAVTGTLKSGSNTISLSGLKAETEYTVVLTAKDAKGNSKDYSVKFTTLAKEVVDTNVAPVASSTTPILVEVENGVGYVWNLTALFSDANGDTLTYAVVSATDNIVSNSNIANGILTVPTTVSAGEYSIVVKANDGKLDSTDNATLVITVKEEEVVNSTYTVTVTSPNTQVNELTFVGNDGSTPAYVGAYYNGNLIVSSETGTFRLMKVFPYADMEYKDADGNVLTVEFK